MARKSNQAKHEVHSVSERESAQERAMRIWNGQSPDVPVKERHARIVSALHELDYDVSEVILPMAQEAISRNDAPKDIIVDTSYIV